ncbi:MAG TPA: Ig-like domain-containing protein [Anaerohalosphaeraceae bacterium]|nr:hypothetical protein [Phycisphaerae bacterium]HOL31914.1 Ig-like domain-containing protein [Anaerohalosphaeraceae bacterium]HPC63923.1 Ig-like domain-containing protein [Anaerohalosphaeraceae bacterium]HRV21043.1 Ig-like domain-containing protein [Anaerohalosphaeraceae bacterium]
MRRLAVSVTIMALSAYAWGLTIQTYGDFNDDQAGIAGFVFTPDLPQYVETYNPMPQTAYLTSWTYARSSSGGGCLNGTYLAVYMYDADTGYHTLLGTSTNYIDLSSAAPLALVTWYFDGIALDKDTQYAMMFVDSSGAIRTGGVELDNTNATTNGCIQTGHVKVNQPTWEAHFSATYNGTVTEPPIDPTNPPMSMRGIVYRNGEIRTFNLEKYNMRGEHFEVILLDSDGVTKIPLDPGPVRTYRGWCEEEPDSYVEATLLPNGDLRYHVFKGDADDWWYDPPYETNDTAAAINNFTLIGGTPVHPSGTAWPGAAFTDAAASLDSYYKTVYQADFGYDVLVEYVNAANFTNEQSYARKAENAMGHYNAIYTRDILLECKLNKVVYRTSNTGLDRTDTKWGIDWWNVNNYWNAMFPDVDHHFIGMVGSVGGGVAFVCDYGGTDWAARSFNGWNSDKNWWHVARHEHGHNLGAGDYDGNRAEGATIMNGNNISLSRLSNAEVNNIMNCRRNRAVSAKLRNIGPFAYPVPPYAKLDNFTAYAGIQRTLDILGNDYDANNDQIALADFPNTTPLGGTLEFSAGTGPNGRDELLYTPPAGQFGTDNFKYSIVDATGRTARGYVAITVDIPTQTIRGHWKLDETTGTTAADSTINGKHGTLTGGITFDNNAAAGQFAGGLTFDGTDDYINLPSLNFTSNTVTITAWIKPDKVQNEYAAIFSNRDGGAANLNFKTNNQLGYHWNDANWTYNSGLSTPVDQWTFVALVIEPNKATFYTSNGTTLNKVIRNAVHNPESFYGSPSIGRDDNGQSSRYFSGAMDDVRIYGIALSENEIRGVIGGGRAESPNPFDNAADIPLLTNLRWSMGSSAVNNDIYFGTDYQTIQNADLTSRVYKGRQPENIFNPGTLKPGKTYFWRIDQITPNGTIIPGQVWRFTATTKRLGGITRQVWQNIGTGVSVSDLTNNANYPDNPSFSEIISSFEAPTNWADAYGSRIHGFIVPPATGSYTFWIAGDDNCQLWLSTDKNPGNAVKIAYIEGNPAWTDSRQWTKYASQKSSPILLTGGMPYYIMALQKEGSGGDNLAVAWEGPGISQQIINGAYLAPYAPDYNWGPLFETDPIVVDTIPEGYSFTLSLAGVANALDGGAITYHKAGGPLWLKESDDMTLEGIPGDGDVGTNLFTITATDSHGQSNYVNLKVNVVNTFTGEAGLLDFAALASRWMDSNCQDIPACGGADLTGDCAVNAADIVSMASMWLMKRTYGGLVAAWPFDADASDIISGHNGTLLNGAAIDSSQSVIGSGTLNLDGIDDYVVVPGYKGISGTASRTCSVWIKTIKPGSQILNWGTSLTGQKWTLRINNDGTLRAEVQDGYMYGTTYVADGNWHHVAVVLADDGSPDISEAVLFVDGQPESIGGVLPCSVHTAADSDVLIGVNLIGTVFFEGLLDEVRIYDRALAYAEILALASIPLQLPSS